MGSKDPNSLQPPALHIKGRTMISSRDDNQEDATGAAPGPVPEVWASKPGTPYRPDSVDQLMNINRYLLAQIEILQLKQRVHANEHEATLKKLLEACNRKLKSRELEVENLKSNLRQKLASVQNLAEEKQHTNSDILCLHEYVANLKEDVKVTKEFADQIQGELDVFPKSPRRTEEECKKDKEISKLRAEPPALHINGRTMISSRNDDQEDATGEAPGPVAEVWASKPGTPYRSDSVDQLMNINRYLLAQIEILQLKQRVHANEHEATRKKLLESSNQKLKSRELEVENLKSNLRQKEASVQNLGEEKQHTNSDILCLHEYVANLKEDVKVTKEFADQIQGELDVFPESPRRPEEECTEDKEISKLRAEVDNLKKHLYTLEQELGKAKKTLAQQGGRLHIMQREMVNAHIKYRDELAKVKQTVRNEITKLRDEVSLQWKTMGEIRDQGKQCNQGLAEIKELLLVQQRTGKVQ